MSEDAPGAPEEVQKLKTSPMFHFSFSLRCARMKKDSGGRHRAEGTDCPAVSAEASGQQITFPAWETIYYPLDFLICTSKEFSKKKKRTEAGGGKDGAAESSAVDWIVCTHSPSKGVTLFEIFC